MWTVPERFVFSIKEGLEGDSWLRRRRKGGGRGGEGGGGGGELSGSQRVLDAKGCCPPPAMCREEECGWEGRGEREDGVWWWGGTGEGTETLTFDWASEMGGVIGDLIRCSVHWPLFAMFLCKLFSILQEFFTVF